MNINIRLETRDVHLDALSVFRCCHDVYIGDEYFGGIYERVDGDFQINTLHQMNYVTLGGALAGLLEGKASFSLRDVVNAYNRELGV